MRRLVVADDGFGAFLGALYSGANAQIWQVQLAAGGNDGAIGDSLLAAMIERGNQGLPFALPFNSGETDHWMLTGGDRVALDRAVVRIGRALVPSFARFSGNDLVASHQLFRPDGNPVQRTGAGRFPVGYYSLIAPKTRRTEVKQRLLRWVELEAAQPPARNETPPTYAQLVHYFHAATAASQWGDAETALDALDRFNLCSADNLRFWQIVLLARQGRWSDLWETPDRRRIIELRLPRAVRAALIQAFHATVLAPVEREGGAGAALARYKTEYTNVGGLLTGRYGLDLPPVLLTYGYDAVHRGDNDAFAVLEEPAEETERILFHELAALLPQPSNHPVASDDAEERVRAALRHDDLDAALVAADDVADPIRRLAARIEIAALSADGPLCVEVLTELEMTETESVGRLLAVAPTYWGYVVRLRQSAGKVPVLVPVAVDLEPARWDVTDWFAWFERAAAAPIDNAAHAALDRIEGSFERSFSDAWASELAELILTVGTDGERRLRPVFRDAIRRLAHELVGETGFPRTGLGARELYDVVVTLLVELAERNDEQSLLLLGLIEAILAQEPSRVASFTRSLTDWFVQPIPALEQRALDAIELAIDYGAGPDSVAPCARTWVEDLLERPTAWDAVRIAVWQRLIRWAQAGPDLDHRLTQRLAEGVAAAEDDPIAALPAGFQIAIFTLRPGSAERAKALLLERNGNLRIAICDAKVLTEQAKNLARNAEMPVIVTGCVKHALTEGIRPFLARDPIYPPANGASGILGVVIDAARLVANSPSLAA